MKPIMSAFISVSGQALTDFEKKYIEKYNPVGVVLFKRNISSKQQLKKLTDTIYETVGRSDFLIAVDQEGGRVCRLEPPCWGSYASQYTLGMLSDDTSEQACVLHAALISSELKEMGINMNFAPVLDCRYPYTSEALKSRCLSDDPERVADLGITLIDSFKNNGICPCIKHLPGHGRAGVDPHLKLPVSDKSLEELNDDFLPFIRASQHAPTGMTAHIVFSKIDERPATQSPYIIREIIRNRIGFKGLLISDALDMNALKGSISERAQASIDAGCDVVCYAFGEQSGLLQLAESTPFLNDVGLERLKNAINTITFPKIKDSLLHEMRQQYDTLVGKAPICPSDYDAVEVLHQMKQTGL